VSAEETFVVAGCRPWGPSLSGQIVAISVVGVKAAEPFQILRWLA
jgi:hypothetical protein